MTEKNPDRRALEKTTSDLSRLVQGKNFKSLEEANAFLKELMDKGGVPKAPPKKAAELAQDIMYEAWDEEDDEERIKLAYEALSISPDCADAYILLAEEKAETLDEVKELYQKGVEAGERALGKETFRKDTGHFWGIIETRPYMRARAGLAQCLWKLGEHEDAISHYQEMLMLNPGDNQGIRYVLASCLANLQRYEELERHLSLTEYKDDCAPDWLYTKALLSFAKNGDSEEARGELKSALKINPHVPEYLVGKKSMPRTLPDAITMGGEDEAVSYTAEFFVSWKKVPGAIEWLKEQTGIKIYHNIGRNAPCPCGSGKKYKKCCGR